MQPLFDTLERLCHWVAALEIIENGAESIWNWLL